MTEQREEQILEAIGEIEEAYIAEALDFTGEQVKVYRKKIRMVRMVKTAAVAAAAVVVVAVGLRVAKGGAWHLSTGGVDLAIEDSASAGQDMYDQTEDSFSGGGSDPQQEENSDPAPQGEENSDSESEGESVMIPNREPNLSESEEEADGNDEYANPFVVYDGKVYETDASSLAEGQNFVAGEHLGTTTGRIKGWSEEDGLVDFASSLEGELYTVKGYDPSFAIGLVTKERRLLMIQNNGITLEKGEDLYEDRLHLAGNYSTVSYQNIMEWRHGTKEKTLYLTDRKEKETVQKLIVALNKGEVMKREEVLPDLDKFWDVLTFRMNNGVRVQLLCSEDGYVVYDGVPYVCVRVSPEILAAVMDLPKINGEAYWEEHEKRLPPLMIEADVTHDGVPEEIFVDTYTAKYPETGEEPTVTVRSGRGGYTIWSLAVNDVVGGWNNVYLYRKKGKVYLMTWEWLRFEGGTRYRWKVFYIVEPKDAKVLPSMEALCDEEELASGEFNVIFSDAKEKDLKRLKKFAKKLNSYLKDAEVLLVTTGSKFWAAGDEVESEDMLYDPEKEGDLPTLRYWIGQNAAPGSFSE